MGSTNEFWHYARQCRELAAKPANKFYRKHMLAMAKKWSRLAAGETGTDDEDNLSSGAALQGAGWPVPDNASEH
jgi:hypothetical protein